MELPGWRLDHLARMTDSTGLFQHASYDDPALRRGLLHRRQRPRPAADRAPGGARPGLGAGPPPGDDLRGVPAITPSTRRGAGSATSWASTAAGSRRSARTTATAGRSGAGGLRRPVAAAGPAVLGLAALRAGAAGDPARRPRPAPGPSALLGHLRVPPAVRRGAAGQPDARRPDRPADRALRQDRRRRLALVRGHPHLRQRPAAARPDRRRPIGRRARGRRKSGSSRCAGWSISRRRRRATSGRSAPTASTAAAASRPSSTSSRSRPMPRSRPASRPTAPPRTPPGSSEARLAFEWFLGRNDLGLDLYDAKSRRLLRRPAGGPRQPEPGGRIDPRVPAVAGRDEPGGEHAGGTPPGAGDLNRGGPRRHEAGRRTSPARSRGL